MVLVAVNFDNVWRKSMFKEADIFFFVHPNLDHILLAHLHREVLFLSSGIFVAFSVFRLLPQLGKEWQAWATSVVLTRGTAEGLCHGRMMKSRSGPEGSRCAVGPENGRNKNYGLEYSTHCYILGKLDVTLKTLSLLHMKMSSLGLWKIMLKVKIVELETNLS